MKYYGLYKITNLLNGKMYIGQHTTSNLDDGYMGSSPWLNRSIKKHGKENFRKEWLMFCEDKDELNYMERVFVDQTWVDRSDTYNLALGGNIKEVSFECRQKMSAALKGRISPRKGKHHTEETRQKMSASHKGRISPLKGKHHTEETKKRISEIKKRQMTLEMRKRISETLTGRKNPTHSKIMSNMKWFNNGKKSTMAYKCPEGYVPGRLPFKKKEGSK